MSMRLGTTGTRAISASEREAFIDRLRSPEMQMWLDQFDGFVSGGCRGWDAIFGETMKRLFPDRWHLVIVPANRSQVDPWWEKFDLGSVTLIFMGEGTTYEDRNQKIVDFSNYLYYMADYPEQHGKSLRSGTWQSVRMGRRKGIVVSGHVIHDDNDRKTNE